MPGAARWPPNIDTTSSNARKIPPHTIRLFTHGLPPADRSNDQRPYVEVFNRGSQPLHFTLTPKQEWLRPAKRAGTVQFEERIEISVDWQKAPPGRSVGELVIAGAGSEYTVTLQSATSSRRSRVPWAYSTAWLTRLIR